MPDNFIWTKHVQERSYQRGITDNRVWSTLRNPDHTKKGSDGVYKFYKNFGDQLVCLVAKPQSNQWLILTTYLKGKSPHVYQRPLIEKLTLRLLLALLKLPSRLFKKHRD